MSKDISFSWDPDKNKRNVKKHSVSFEEALTVFYDEDHSAAEDRFVIIGASNRLRTLIVCHCFHHEDTEIRIISARKANISEHKQYEEPLKRRAA